MPFTGVPGLLAGAQALREPSSVTTRAALKTAVGRPAGRQDLISDCETFGVSPTSP
jgi:hypothetical protein